MATLPYFSFYNTDVIIPDECVFAWDNPSLGYCYKIQLRLGTWSSNMSGAICPTQVGYFRYTNSTLMNADNEPYILEQIPNSTTGTMTAYLFTYSDPGCTKLVGYTTCSFRAHVRSDILPMMNSNGVSIINDNPTIASWGVAVAGFSKFKLLSTALGRYGSTIKSYRITKGYDTIQNGVVLDYTGGIIYSSGEIYFLVSATDSRGRTSLAKSTQKIVVHEYFNPSISKFEISRGSSDKTQVEIFPQWTYASVDENNHAVGRLQYKRNQDKNWSTYQPDIINNQTNIISITGGFSTNYSYDFRLIVTDDLGNSGVESAFLSGNEVLVDLGGRRRLGIGRFAESDRLEIDLDTLFIGEIKLRDGEGGEITLEDYIKRIAGIT